MKNTIKLILIAIIVAIGSINLKGQTIISDKYSDYSLIETKQTNSYGKENNEKAYAIFQMERKKYSPMKYIIILLKQETL